MIFQRMMARARDLKCGVYIPAGMYMCQPTRVGDTLMPMYSGIILRGDGASTVITMPSINETIASPYYSPIMTCNTIRNYVVRDLVFDGNRHLKSDGTYFGSKSNSSGVEGIYILNSTGGTFENVVCQNCVYFGFRIAGVTRTTFDLCKALSVYGGFSVFGSNPVSNLTITNSLVDGFIDNAAITIYKNAQSKNITITNNKFKGNGKGIGLYIYALTAPSPPEKVWNENIVVSRNIIDNFSAGIIIRYTSHLVFNGNIVSQSVSGSNLELISCYDTVVTGNQFYYSANNTIEITESSHILVSDNLLKDNGATRTVENSNFGYFSLKDNSNVSIRGNHIYQGPNPNPSNPAQNIPPFRRTIRFDTGNDKIVFHGNDIYNDPLTTGYGARVYIEGTNNQNCLRNSFIEIPPYTNLYNARPAGTNATDDYSNVIYRRVDELISIVDASQNELARCCVIDPVVRSFNKLGIKAVNTRVLLIFNPNRGVGTQLPAGGNIRFNQNNLIPGNETWHIQLISVGTEWVEVSRTKLG